MSEAEVFGAGVDSVRGGEAAGNRLYDSNGQRFGTPAQSGQRQTEQLTAFMRDEPLASALIALIVGYLLGKIT
jgi:hypothetical protein